MRRQCTSAIQAHVFKCSSEIRTWVSSLPRRRRNSPGGFTSAPVQRGSKGRSPLSPLRCLGSWLQSIRKSSARAMVPVASAAQGPPVSSGRAAIGVLLQVPQQQQSVWLTPAQARPRRTRGCFWSPFLMETQRMRVKSTKI